MGLTLVVRRALVEVTKSGWRVARPTREGYRVSLDEETPRSDSSGVGTDDRPGGTTHNARAGGGALVVDSVSEANSSPSGEL